MSDLRLVIFDVDGTLVDSQDEIWAAMRDAFAAVGLPMPARAAVLGIVGLSLAQAFAQLASDQTGAVQAALVDAYKSSFAARRRATAKGQGSPLYPGARAALDQLQAQDHTLLALATGKSRRGLVGLIEAHDLHGLFASQHCADDHPSKPNPSMVLACLRDTGVAAQRAIMVGDTCFDMDMARAASVATIGVTWGYHSADSLNADHILTDFADLPGVIDMILEQ
ncbi:MAG: HAD-IA family hydrolase [Paracoccaceae bacterium]